jgi:hypothetical protein
LKLQSPINESSTKPFVISGSQSLPNSQERFRDFWEVGINVPRRQEFLLQFFCVFSTKTYHSWIKTSEPNQKDLRETFYPFMKPTLSQIPWKDFEI